MNNISRRYISPYKSKIFQIFWISILFLFHFPSFGKNIQTKLNSSSSSLVFNFIDINGKKITTKNSKAAVLLFFDSQNTTHKLALSYARILFNKYRSDGLTIIGITDQDKATLREFSQMGRISFPLISDPKNQLFEKFKIKSCCGGTVVINKEGREKFALSMLVDKVTLRQLIEQEIYGKIIYHLKKPIQSEPFKLNKPAPAIPIQEISSNEILNFGNFGEDYVLVTFFSSMCTTCKTGRRVNMMKGIENELQLNHINAKTILVFFRPFDKNDISNWETAIEMPFDKFISDDIFSDEERYVTDGSIVPDPFTVVLDKQRKVILIEQPNASEQILSASIIKRIKNSKL